MRKIILSNMVTLDGYMEGPNQSIDWHHVDADFFETANVLMDSVDTHLYGRVTYQVMESYWPTEQAMKGDPATAVRMNETPKIVFSRTLAKADWKNTRLIKDNVAEEVMKLKRLPGKDMLMFGSSNLAKSFLEMGLMDEVLIYLNPVAIGDGTPLFKGLKDKVEFKLLDSQVFKNGNVLLKYQPLRKAI
jgi:dihydrofolate reductase